MPMNITINQNDNQNIGISNRDTQDIIVNNNEIQTIRVESNTPQTLGINQNENQLILIGGGGEVIGITDVLVNGVTVVSGNIAYITVPTKTSELTNNSGFITSETDPTVPSYVKQISLADINNWNNKQEQLVSGSNIKTINNTSLLGSGNIDITGGTSYTAGTGINIENGVISNTITNYNDLSDLPTIPNKTSDLINDEDFVSEDDLSEVAFTGSYNSLSDTPVIPDSTSDLINDSDFITSSEVSTEIQTAIATKQDTLVSGTNIKTINNNSLLGSGNLGQFAYSNSNNSFSGTQSFNNISISGDLSTTGHAQIFNYWTGEERIGTWIDDRPLYRNIFTFTFANANQWNIINHNISGIYEIINFKTIMKYLANNYYYEVPNDIVLETRLNTTDYGYYFTNAGMQNNATALVIMEYTKNS